MQSRPSGCWTNIIDGVPVFFTHAAQHSTMADQMAQLASDAMEPADIEVLRLQLKLDNRTKPGTLAAAAALATDAGRDPARPKFSVSTVSHQDRKGVRKRLLRASHRSRKWWRQPLGGRATL